MQPSPSHVAKPHSDNSSAPASQPNASVHSQQLLQGQKKVQILHHDQVYVLQTTRQGKLILTK
jgi:hemin uptake protein HemP